MVERVKANAMSSFISEIEKRQPINEGSLDKELKENPEILYDVAKELALAISRRDAAKQALKEEEAEFAIEYRSTAKKKEEKVTEKEIEAATIADENIQKLNQDLLKYGKEVGLLTALKDSFRDRGFAIHKLVDMALAHFYETEASTQKDRGRLKEARVGKAKEELRSHYLNERNRREDPPF